MKLEDVVGTLFLLFLVALFVIGSWTASAHTIGTECRTIGVFSVEGRIFECKERK